MVSGPLQTEFDDPELGEIHTWDGKKVANYMFLHTQLDGETNQVNTIDTEGHRTLIYEMGHMLGLDDYYNSDNTVTKVGSSTAVAHSMMVESADGETLELVLGISVFDENGVLIKTKVLPADTDLSYIESVTATGFGYHMVSVLLDGSAVHTFLNKDLEVITSVETSSNDGCAMGDQFVFSGNTINGTVISITGSVVKNESDQEEGQNGTGDGQTPNNGSGSENSSDNTSNKENTVNGGKSPKTGDTAPVLYYLFIGLISVAVILKKSHMGSVC